MFAYWYDQKVGQRALSLLNREAVFYIFGQVKVFDEKKGSGIIKSFGKGDKYSFNKNMLTQSSQHDIKYGDKVCIAFIQQDKEFIIKKILKNGSLIDNKTL
ncbi:hypothetical protein [Bartonella sp. DGB1]|uniref:hypothetical protein n=1 Tax=Bartonella sp. DGB1 TaxID=3239807 RepID=UPI003526871D